MIKKVVVKKNIKDFNSIKEDLAYWLKKHQKREQKQQSFLEDNYMEVQKDFKELLELFNKHNVEYMIVGAYALAFHGAPHYTGDLDIFVRPNSINATRIMKALKDFGFDSFGLNEADFEKPGFVIQLGVPPIRINILTTLTEISWEIANKNKVIGKYGDIQVYYIGREEFIINKRKIGRKRSG